MTDAAKKVLAGFVRISADDKKEVLDEINRYYQGNEVTRNNLQESWTKAAGVWSGPVSVGCPCCGK
jgi:hypothetical protein